MKAKTTDIKELMRRLAASRELGIRRIVLVGKGDQIEVLGAGVGQSAAEPEAYRSGRGVVGVDRYRTAEDTLRGLTALVGDQTGLWLRCLDGVVVAEAVGDGRFLFVETVGEGVFSGTLRTYLFSLARFLRDGTPPSMPRDAPS